MAYTYYTAFTVDHTQVPNTDQTNFPVGIIDNSGLARLKTTGNGGHVSNANGYDIRPFSDSGLTTALTYELVFYDAATGKIEMWVKIPTLSHTSDTIIYLGYGNSSITTDGSSNTTWDSNYLGVYHLSNGTTLSGADSSQSGRTGTLVNTPTATAGQIDGAGNFVFASSQYIDLGTGYAPTALTMSAWAKANSYTNNNINAILVRNNNSTSWAYVSTRTISGTTKVLYELKGNTDLQPTSTPTTLTTGVWYYFTVTYDSSGGLIGYINGAVEGTHTANGALATTSASTMISRDNVPGGLYWDGIIDECRMSDAVRSADWITTEYNNQVAPGTFYAVGTEQAVGGGPTPSGMFAFFLN